MTGVPHAHPVRLGAFPLTTFIAHYGNDLVIVPFPTGCTFVRRKQAAVIAVPSAASTGLGTGRNSARLFMLVGWMPSSPMTSDRSRERESRRKALQSGTGVLSPQPQTARGDAKERVIQDLANFI